MDDLRSRLAELPKEKELLVFCEVGQRGYVAARLLSQHGFRVRNLSGGYKRYLMWKSVAEASRVTHPPDVRRGRAGRPRGSLADHALPPRKSHLAGTDQPRRRLSARTPAQARVT